MGITVRRYNPVTDFVKVGRFLVKTYRTTGDHINWVQPRWEYMHYHPLIRGVDLNAIGFWVAHGELVGVVHPEHVMGTAFFELDSEYPELKGEMLRYAETLASFTCRWDSDKSTIVRCGNDVGRRGRVIG